MIRTGAAIFYLRHSHLCLSAFHPLQLRDPRAPQKNASLASRWDCTSSALSTHREKVLCDLHTRPRHIRSISETKVFRWQQPQPDFFSFLLSVTWPSLLKAFNPQGPSPWYAVCNILGFFGVLFLVPETKGKTFEELDQFFSIRSRDHAAYGLRQSVYFLINTSSDKISGLSSCEKRIQWTITQEVSRRRSNVMQPLGFKQAHKLESSQFIVDHWGHYS